MLLSFIRATSNEGVHVAGVPGHPVAGGSRLGAGEAVMGVHAVRRGRRRAHLARGDAGGGAGHLRAAGPRRCAARAHLRRQGPRRQDIPRELTTRPALTLIGILVLTVQIHNNNHGYGHRQILKNQSSASRTRFRIIIHKNGKKSHWLYGSPLNFYFNLVVSICCYNDN